MEDKLKHLEFIQNIISRMASNSFLIKGWAITLVTALLALAAAKDSLNTQSYTSLVILPTVLFWFLDAYYISKERQFRELYATIAKQPSNVTTDFLMPLKRENRNTWFSSLFSIAAWPLYLSLLLFIIIILLIL